MNNRKVNHPRELALVEGEVQFKYRKKFSYFVRVRNKKQKPKEKRKKGIRKAYTLTNRTIVTEGSFRVLEVQAKLKMLVLLNWNHAVPGITLLRNSIKMMVLSVMISGGGSSGGCSEVVVVTTRVTVINKVQILVNLTTVQEPIIVAVRDSAGFDRVEQEPGSGFVFVIHVSTIVVVGDVDFDVRVVAGGDGEDGDAVMAACEGVGGVDVGVA